MTYAIIDKSPSIARYELEMLSRARRGLTLNNEALRVVYVAYQTNSIAIVLYRCCSRVTKSKL